MRTNASRLVVFVKAPRAGAVKTRLAGTLLANLAPLPRVELCFTPAEAGAEIQPWVRPGWLTCPQVGGGLGERLHAAFAEHFETDAQHVVIIGSDCPDVTATDIEDAWLALEGHDVVLGPALDGGYWLIGLRAPQPALFTGIPWSTDRVFGETMCRARETGLRVALLRELADVDTAADWERWLRRANVDVSDKGS
jgi:uncharacterized protein